MDKIEGYRELSEADIKMVNEIKKQANVFGDIIDELAKVSSVDYRWLAISKTHLQQGVMALVRSITNPTGF